MHSNQYSIVVTGLGGQGVLLVSKVLAAAAWRTHEHVCRTESRGLSQRGGSVSTIVRFGSRPVAPVVGNQSADALLSTDLLESARSLNYLKPDGILVSNEQYTLPLSLVTKWRNSSDSLGLKSRLAEHIHSLCDAFEGTCYVQFSELAEKMKFPKGVNSMLLGAASVFVPIPHDDLREETILAVKPQFGAVNAQAFDLGRAAVTMQLFERKNAKPVHLATA